MDRLQRKKRTLILGLLACALLITPLAASAAPPTEPTDGCTGVVQIPLSECQALETLYNSTAGPQWTDKSGWLVTTTPCSWYGVTCQSGHVTELDLQDNNLNGSLPSQLADLTSLERLLLLRNDLAGSIPTSLGSFGQLQELDLSENDLTGGIPSQLGSLAQLQRLRLSNNMLTGAIPSQVGNLSALQVLDISTNQLTGQIPAGFSGLSNIEELLLANNQLTGSIPTQLTGLTHLRRLVLARNQLTGAIPSQLGNISTLTYLILDHNQLGGAIPPGLGSLPVLRFLVLSNNRLTGSIPVELANVATLQEVWVNSNALSGSVPAGLCDLENLSYMDLGYNAITSAPACILTFDPFWEETQTVAPADFHATNATGSSISLAWTPIEYTYHGGYYEISYRPAGGSFVVAGTTADKTANTFTVTGLTPNLTYELRIRTYTPAHDTPPAYQQNALWSDYTTTTAQTVPGSVMLKTYLPLLQVH